jgi:hypothetical protein
MRHFEELQRDTGRGLFKISEMRLLAPACLAPLLFVAPPAALLPARAPPPCLSAKNAPPSPPASSLPLLLQPEPAIAAGVSLVTALLINRLFTDDLLNSQSRADLIATVAPTLITLKALGDLDIEARQAEPKPLDGPSLRWVEPSLSADQRRELEWAADSLRACESCAAVALYVNGRTLLLHGTVATACADAPEAAVAPGPLVTKATESVSGAPDYLPSLPILPGRFEFFGYFPEATQGVLMVPIPGSRGAFILASDRQRGFQQSDILWARSVAGRVAELKV